MSMYFATSQYTCTMEIDSILVTRPLPAGEEAKILKDWGTMLQVQVGTVFGIIGLMLLAIPSDVIAQDITGKDGLKSGDFGCLGSEVTFTCRTSGSQAIAWRSNEYIGSGNNQLGMVMGINSIGEPLTAAEGKTVAMLTKAYEDDNGVQVLESTLRIIVTSFPNPSVICTNGTDLGLTTFRFAVPATPYLPQNFAAMQLQCPGLDTCYALGTWQIPENNETAFVTGYNISVDGGDFMALQFNEMNTSNGSGLNGVHRLSSCSNHSISASLKATNVCGGSLSVTVVLNKTSTDPLNVCKSDSGTSSNKYSFNIVITLMMVVVAMTVYLPTH